MKTAPLTYRGFMKKAECFLMPALFFLLLLIPAESFAVSKYKGIEPGKTANTEVSGILGEPKAVSETVYEYPSSDTNIDKVSVEFKAADGSQIVDELTVYFTKPVPREGIVNAMKLSEASPLEKLNDQGRFQEFYGATNSIILTYKDKTPKSGVMQISYLTRDRFEAITKDMPKTPVDTTASSDKPATSNDKGKAEPKEKTDAKKTETAKVSPEAKQHLQQGMTYVSLAKSNPKTESENYSNALMEFSKAIEISPNYAEAYSDRGVVYMQQKKYNKAEIDLKKAAELSPKDPYVLYNLTALYSVEKKNDLALDYLDQALKNGFDNYDVLRPTGKNSDPDLANIRKDPEFKTVLEKNKVFILK